MHNKRLYKKLNTLLDILIMSLPLIYIILFFINHNFNPITNFEGLSDILENMFGDTSYLGNMLKSLLSYLGITNLGGFYNIAIGIIDFAFCIWLLDMVKDLIMWIISIPYQFFEKD